MLDLFCAFSQLKKLFRVVSHHFELGFYAARLRYHCTCSETEDKMAFYRAGLAGICFVFRINLHPEQTASLLLTAVYLKTFKDGNILQIETFSCFGFQLRGWKMGVRHFVNGLNQYYLPSFTHVR